MSILPFKESAFTSVGVEIELQLISPHNQDLTSKAKELLKSAKGEKFGKNLKPEVTQSMVEINSGVHQTVDGLEREFDEMHTFLLKLAQEQGIELCGGGTHPFEKWSAQKIYPFRRFKVLTERYKYLSKRSTVFGQHVHVGCRSGEEALYLTHALARYVPHFIALSASSPFYQRVDTGFNSCRSTVFNAFPTSGFAPYLTCWDEFMKYFQKLYDLNIVKSMKDFYWDIRPKPEFGTVEVRVFDTPLTLHQGLVLAAYVQTLAYCILTEKKFRLTPDLYYLYNYNRFQGCRYGMDASIVDYQTMQEVDIKEDIIKTLDQLSQYATKLKTNPYLQELKNQVSDKRNDAVFLRDVHKGKTFKDVVVKQCEVWKRD